MTEKVRNIRKVVERFTNPTIGDEIPNHLCFCTCFPLLIYLQLNNIRTSLVAGNYENIRHFWLKLDEYPNIIIDPTVRQFDFTLDKIYIGPLLTEKYTADNATFRESFFWAFKFWAEPLLDRLRTHSHKVDDEERTNKFNIKFALILNNEIAAKHLNNDLTKQGRFCRLYFAVLYKHLRLKIKQNTNYLQSFNSFTGLEKLLEKALRS